MKNYSEYWKKEITDNEECNYEWFCREKEPKEHFVYMFCTETCNDGPCCASAGVWRWAEDTCKLASWIIEFQLRNIFSCCDEGKDVEETLERAGTEYLRFIAESAKGNRGEKVRKDVCSLAEEMQEYIDAGTLTFDIFADWIKRYKKVSEDMPVLVDFEIFNGLDGAIELLYEHENSSEEDLENLTLLERFQADFTC